MKPSTGGATGGLAKACAPSKTKQLTMHNNRNIFFMKDSLILQKV
jgi:hypothetical protein